MDNFDGYPAPEARVREYLEAGDFDMGSDEIDEISGATLNASDLRDVLREAEASRAVIAEIRRLADNGITSGNGISALVLIYKAAIGEE